MFKENLGKKLIFGLVHLLPMPGTPYYTEGNVEKMLDKALHDVDALQKGGAHGCLLQSSDGIYQSTDDTDYARVATLAMIGARVRQEVGPDFKIGVQLMWNCITPSLAVAKAVGADFTRCTALVGTTQSQFGPVTGDPYKIISYRNLIGAQGVDMISEAAGYHFKSEYDKNELKTRAATAIRYGAAAIEILSKDEAHNEQMVRDIKELGDVPVILGGGTDVENCVRRMKYADAALVGTCFEDGKWGGPINVNTVKAYMDNMKAVYDC